MKEITINFDCQCGYNVQRVFYINEYGYLEIPQSYCPNCFCILTFQAPRFSIDIVETGKKT